MQNLPQPQPAQTYQQPPQGQQPFPQNVPQTPPQSMASSYPHIYLVAFLIHMIGLIIIFIGVFLVGAWISDLANVTFGSSMYDDLGDSVKTLAFGGMIYSAGTITKGIAKYYDTRMNAGDRIRF